MSDSDSTLVTIPHSPAECHDDEVQWLQYPQINSNRDTDPLNPWNEFSQPEMVPVTSLESRPVYSSTNGFSNMNNSYEHSSYSPNGSVNNPNGLILPNGTRVFNHNNGANGVLFHHRAPNGWSSPSINPGRSIARPNKPGGSRKPKRIRTAFNSHQMMELEQEYTRTRYLDRNRRIELADYLHLNERTIKIWFQNRRMKEKKDKTESLEEDDEATSTTDSSSEFVLPVVASEQMPFNAIHQRDAYSYYNPYTSSMISSTQHPETQGLIVHGPGPMTNGFPSLSSEQYEMRQMNNMHLLPPQYNGEVLEIKAEGPPGIAEVESPQPGNMVEQNWDVSWIKSIHLTDDC